MEKEKKERRRKSATISHEQREGLLAWRKAITQEDVAKICEVHPNTISRLCREGSGDPDTVESVLKNMPKEYITVQLQFELG